MQKAFLNAVLLLTLVPATARAQINAGELKPEPNLPFTMTEVASVRTAQCGCSRAPIPAGYSA